MSWAQRPAFAPFLVRLRQSADFGPADLAALSALPVEVRPVEANTTFIRESRRGEHAHVVLDGWAARFKILENGSRQVPALLLAGDVCDLDQLHLDHVDCGVIALNRCTVATLPRDALLGALDAHRGLRRAIGRMAAVENAIATQWTVCLGRGSARERLAHLLCELLARLHAVGAASADACTFPLTQEQMADVLGLTSVHVNRTLQGLRSEGLIALRDQRLTVLDPRALRRAGGFEGHYLHIGPPQDIGAARARPDAGPLGLLAEA